MRDDAERLFERARALPPESRARFIDEACADDAALRAELLSLLQRSDAAEEFFGLLGDAVRSISFSAAEGGARAEMDREALGVPSHRASSTFPGGREVGRYRILAQVGRGGMGTVYRAHDPRLGRDVALKFLPSHLRASGEAEERLLIEARAAAALEHPNVCTVYEIGETEDGQPFIAMALYQGETLKERLRRGPLLPAEAVDVAIQMARGLGAAHERGILHRDVKPGNVMLTGEGTVKLLDFGLAKMADVGVTRPGTTPGTLAYMSPEQVQGEALDRRTDLWSLGVVLYEMLTGERPFRGGSDGAVIQNIRNESPEPVARLRPDCPDLLSRTVGRLLEKAPDARYQSADELLSELTGREDRGTGIPRLLIPTRRRSRVLLAGVAASVVALAGVTLVRLSDPGTRSVPDGPAAAPGRASIAVLPLVNRSGDPSDDALADGMTEELITILAQTGDLRVIASTSAFAFKGRQIDARRIADSLGVSHLLEGSLRVTADSLHMQVRMVDGSDGSTRWSGTFDRELRSVFAVQDEIARAVAGELDLRLTTRSGAPLSRSYTPDIAAYELYLRGSDQALLRSDGGVRQGVEYFRQAIEADSNYAAAWAGLARMYMVLSGRGDPGSPVRDLHAIAEEAARKALALDDSLAEAHATLGLIHKHARYDFPSAESELKRAIALDPSQALPRQWLAQLYIQTGRPREALAEAERAVRSDPLSPSAHAEVAHALLTNRRPDEALARLERISAVDPPLLRAAGYAARAYAMKGMWSEAIAAVRPQATSGGGYSLPLYAYMLARGGEREEALRVLDTLLDRWREGTTDGSALVIAYAGLREFDQAFAWLERSLEDRSVVDPNLGILEPIFDDLRRDPRFEPFRERLGLPAP